MGGHQQDDLAVDIAEAFFGVEDAVAVLGACLISVGGHPRESQQASAGPECNLSVPVEPERVGPLDNFSMCLAEAEVVGDRGRYERFAFCAVPEASATCCTPGLQSGGWAS